VFQSCALCPCSRATPCARFLTVSDNVAFGLRNCKLPAAEVSSRVSAALALVKLEAFGKRRPAQLSGRQQQRVALAASGIMPAD
jgi:putrescine transport system ATP-binding protein